MKSKRRWMQSIMNEVAKSEVQMPWARGTRRAEMKTRISATVTAKATVRA